MQAVIPVRLPPLLASLLRWRWELPRSRGTTIDSTGSAGANETAIRNRDLCDWRERSRLHCKSAVPTDSYDNIYGAVAQGVFTGSSSEAGR